MNQHSGLQIGSYRGAPIYLKASWFIFMILLIVGYGSHLSAWPALTVADGFTAAAVVAVTVAVVAAVAVARRSTTLLSG